MRDADIYVIGQQTVNGDDKIEERHAGSYDCRDGRHFIRYETEDGVRHLVRLDAGTVTVNKSGAVTATLSFISGQRTHTVYDLGFGEMDMEIFTKEIKIAEEEAGMFFTLLYDLYINGEFYSDCAMIYRVSFTGKP